MPLNDKHGNWLLYMFDNHRECNERCTGWSTTWL